MNDRIYKHSDDGQWYFTIRGNQRSGPFATYDEAEAALDKHVNRCRARVSHTRLRWPRSWNPLRALRRSSPRHS